METENLLFEEKDLYQPTLEEIRDVLSNGLTSNFKHVTVEVVDCPNLRAAPFYLAGRGLAGSTSLVDLGGVPYLLPLVDRTRLYNLNEICKKIYGNDDSKEYFVLGAGAGPFPVYNSNIEGVYNIKSNADGTLDNESYTARVDEDKKCVLEKISDRDASETRVALLANLFLCEGKQEKVVRVHCKQRTGDDDFIASMRKTLDARYNPQTVGLGGVFLMKKGSAKQHVMQDFSKTPITTDDELNNWLKFYEMPATLIALGTLITNDNVNLDLRVQHFHSFSKHGVGGHYHIDTTPEIVEYEGFFNIGEKIIRIDKPLITHEFGRD